MNICIYGAASENILKIYISEGEKLGFELSKRGHNLVFGGGNCGLMGAVARGALSEGKAEIIGIVPSFFTDKGKRVDGILFKEISKLIETETMSERKMLLNEQSDAVVITPGGIGTYDEMFEMLTLKSLGRHKKPMALLNTNGYFEGLLGVLHKGIEDGFIASDVINHLFISDDVTEILDYIEQNVF